MDQLLLQYAADIANGGPGQGRSRKREEGTFTFSTLAAVAQAVHDLGYHLTIPQRLEQRQAVLCAEKSGKLSVTVVREAQENIPDRWYAERGKLVTIVGASPKPPPTPDNGDLSSLVRAISSTAGKHVGFVSMTERAVWTDNPRENVKAVLIEKGYPVSALSKILGELCLTIGGPSICPSSRSTPETVNGTETAPISFSTGNGGRGTSALGQDTQPLFRQPGLCPQGIGVGQEGECQTRL